MRPIHCSRLLNLIGMVAFSILISTPSLAEDTTLLSIGPRFGFSGKTPLMGKQQKYNFYLTDVAAVFKLPWSRPLGESPWKLETRLITSAGVLAATDEYGLMATAVPCLALSGWNRVVSLDIGVGLGFFSRDKYGVQDFGGPVQIVATAGLLVNPIPHAYAGFRLQHFSDAGVYGPTSLGVDMYIVEAGYRF
ncbi:MAG TPA: acyloxyacyl hydrolase [Nitrospiraceae bacterium]|nr:acyloxyacyl hydrolase [Nitrospiraceae bacterium]